jgi:hypothetical protein
VLVFWRGLGDDFYLRDVGSFSPNVTVRHTFPAPQVFASGLTCRIESVHFVDGTTWQASLENQ